MTATAHNLFAFALTWDQPGTTRVRGLLVVALAVVILVGSIYLLLATNLGSRVGFLVALAGFSGWMALMALVWALYGIGYKGETPSWHVAEVVTSDDLDDLSAAQLEQAHDLADWKELAADNPARGEAQAAATAALIADQGEGPVAVFTSESEFQVVRALDKGGKSDSFLNDWVPGPHPPHHLIVQVQAVKPVEVAFGEAPPVPEVDSSAPVHSVVLLRDLGSLRLPSVLVALASLIVFGVTCNVLHRRDKAIIEARAAVGT